MGINCKCGRSLDSLGGMVIPDERTVAFTPVKTLPDPSCNKACDMGKGAFYVDAEWWGQLRPVEKAATLGHELGHRLLDTGCDDCADRVAGIALARWGYGDSGPAALGRIIESRPRAGEHAMQGWKLARGLDVAGKKPSNGKTPTVARTSAELRNAMMRVGDTRVPAPTVSGAPPAPVVAADHSGPILGLLGITLFFIFHSESK